MRFRQIDQITLLEPGVRIEALKRLSGEEDYLRDHFPRFAVMPGVLMLESLYQAATHLVRATEGYQAGLVRLKAAKNVKFADFVQPGEQLNISAEIIKQDGNVFTLKATGQKETGKTCVSGRLLVEAELKDSPDVVDQHAAQYMRQMANQLQQTAMA